jgi:Rieske Fe-S protein
MADAQPAVSDRRGFMKMVAGLLAAAAGTLAAVPVLGSALSPLLRPKSAETGFLRAAAVEDLEPGVPRRVELTGVVVDGWTRAVGVLGAVWLLKKADGTVLALSSFCPHSGCSIGQKTQTTYTCPCHDSTFQLDGTASDGPSPRPMDPLEVQLQGKEVFVRWRRFKVGVKERKEIG